MPTSSRTHASRAVVLLALASACALDRGGLSSIARPGDTDMDPSQADGDGDTPRDGDGLTGDGDATGDGAQDGSPQDGAEVDDPEFSDVAVFRTTADGTRALSQEPDLHFSRGTLGAHVVIDIDDHQRLQAFDGVGGQLHDAAASLMTEKLDDMERRTLLRRLFDPTAGSGMSVVRVPVGASNYAREAYTYDDTAPNLDDFSLGRDEDALIPVLTEARAIQPDLLLFAAPWSAPAWMKAPRTLMGGSLQRTSYPLFAAYLAEFVTAYAKHGLAVYALSPQNEPYYAPAGIDYPATQMTFEAEGDFVADHLGPLFRERGLATKLVAWDHNWDVAETFAGAMLERREVRAELAGTALHCYLGDASAQTRLHERFPDRDLWLTECAATANVNGFQNELSRAMQVAIAALSNWSRSVLLSSLTLDGDHGPRLGGCTDCGSAAHMADDGAITPSGELYALGHFGKFVARAAQRVSSTVTGGTLPHVAFVNPDRSRVLVVFNPASEAQTFAVNVRGQNFTASIDPGAALTFHWLRTGGPMARTLAVAQASNTASNMPPEYAIDGDPTTRWSSGLPQGGEQWFELDLGSAKPVASVTLDAGGNPYDYPRRYAVRLSNDGVTYTEVATGQGDAGLLTARFPRTSARFVRVVSQGTSLYWWSIGELTLGN